MTLIRTIGSLSEGIRISLKEGINSARMLKYVYNNKAHGKFLIGKKIDRIYLNHAGWEAVRQRKANLKMYIKKAIESNRKHNIKTYIVDIASGPARYIIEVLKEVGEEDIDVKCFDQDERMLGEREARTKELGLNNILYKKQDPFDIKSLLSTSSSVNIVVSSGFYDLITNDKLVKETIDCAFKMLSSKGKFILTNQVSHHDFELITKAFATLESKPLEIKTRPIKLMTSWLQEAGFKNIISTLDKYDFYAVIEGEKP